MVDFLGPGCPNGTYKQHKGLSYVCLGTSLKFNPFALSTSSTICFVGCNCNHHGTQNGSNVCDKTTGSCSLMPGCKVEYNGTYCRVCSLGYFDTSKYGDARANCIGNYSLL